MGLIRFWLSIACLALFWLGAGVALAQNACNPKPFPVTMATPVSSRINWKGDGIEAVLTHPLPLSATASLPAGTLLKGEVTEVKPYGRKQPGMIRLTFNIAPLLAAPSLLTAQVATPDGWLRQSDRNSPDWQVNANHSTRLLNEKIQRRLGSNRAVWASVLGINENIIPNPTSDAFIVQYNRNDVLVGAGDSILLRLRCP